PPRPIQPYQGGFLLHCLDLLVYRSISATLLSIARVVVEDRSALTFSHVTGSRSGIGCPSQMTTPLHRCDTFLSVFALPKQAWREKKGEYGNETRTEPKQGEAASCDIVSAIGRADRYSWERGIQPHSLGPSR